MIAITGATGLLGSFILKRFTSEGIPVRALSRSVEKNTSEITWVQGDVSDMYSLSELVKGADAVIHAAGLVSFNPQKKYELLKVNMEGTRNVVNSCLDEGVSKFIHISSVAALGRQKGMRTLDEETKWVESPINSDYARSKYLAELEVFRGQEEGLDVSVILPSIILAPSDWNRSSAQLFKYIWNESPFYVKGLTNYVDVRDVVEIIFRTYQQNAYGSKLIASAGSIPYEKLFAEIAARFGKRPPRYSIPSGLTKSLAFLEEIRARATGREPLISRQSVRMTGENFTYSNSKSMQSLDITYRTLNETLDWCCPYFAAKS